ncbi:hypothetical protein RUM44_000320 [Polyplax serrata]|uniref:Uncharacterized protein n=1 Tax=Polyplax serrata TaxID=468196 RepID=A0ABR1B562_POLSC
MGSAVNETFILVQQNLNGIKSAHLVAEKNEKLTWGGKSEDQRGSNKGRERKWKGQLVSPGHSVAVTKRVRRDRAKERSGKVQMIEQKGLKVGKGEGGTQRTPDDVLRAYGRNTSGRETVEGRRSHSDGRNKGWCEEEEEEEAKDNQKK